MFHRRNTLQTLEYPAPGIYTIAHFKHHNYFAECVTVYKIMYYYFVESSVIVQEKLFEAIYAL